MARTTNPIKSPLLALPYGKPPFPREFKKHPPCFSAQDRTCMFTYVFAEEKADLYATRHQEAVKIFNALLAQESLADPIKHVQEVVQKCFDMEDLQSEVGRG